MFKMDRIVGIGECIVSNNVDDTIKTFALGSCVAITTYSPSYRVAGMAHIALPSSELPGIPTGTRPCYYATTAIPMLINKMCLVYGCSKSDLRIELFGGANSVRSQDMFKIGKRNIEIIKRILTDLNLPYSAIDIGGTYSRTVQIDVATGSTKVSTQPMVI